MVPEEVPRGHSNTIELRHRAQKVYFYVISIRSGSETRYNRFQRVFSPVLNRHTSAPSLTPTRASASCEGAHRKKEFTCERYPHGAREKDAARRAQAGTHARFTKPQAPLVFHMESRPISVTRFFFSKRPFITQDGGLRG